MKIKMIVLFLLLMMIVSYGIAEEVSVTKTECHIIGQEEKYCLEDIVSNFDVNWVVFSPVQYLSEHLEEFVRIEEELAIEDGFIVMIPHVDSETEKSLYTKFSGYQSPMVILVLSDEDLDLDQPLVCFYSTDCEPVSDLLGGNPLGEEMLSVYYELKPMGQVDMDNGSNPDIDDRKEESSNEEPAEQQNEAPKDETVQHETQPLRMTIINREDRYNSDNTNVGVFKGETLDGQAFDSTVAFQDNITNFFVLCDIDSFTEEEYFNGIYDVARYFQDQLRDSKYWIMITNGFEGAREYLLDYWPLNADSVIILNNNTNSSLLNNLSQPIACFVNRDGVLVAETIPISTENEEKISYMYVDIAGNARADAGVDSTGRKVPEFDVTELYSGNVVHSSELFSESRLTVVNLWATYCGPCIGELPELDKLNESLKPMNAKVVGFLVDYAEDPDSKEEEVLREGKALLEEANAKYENYVARFDIGRQLPFGGTPVTYFIDSNGIIVEECVLGGYMDQVQQRVDHYLK